MIFSFMIIDDNNIPLFPSWLQIFRGYVYKTCWNQNISNLRNWSWCR